MRFTKTNLEGVYLIDIDSLEDSRGFFARTFCKMEFIAHNLNGKCVQTSISFNKQSGTIRGVHYHKKPCSETKLVRCTSGAVYDVILDIREDSATFKQWQAFELTRQNRRAIYVPAGLAHGFQTLEGSTEVFYQVSEYFRPGGETGVRWDDPAFGIVWPMPVSAISEKDLSWPDWKGSQ